MVKERTKFSSALDRCCYYDSIISDINNMQYDTSKEGNFISLYILNRKALGRLKNVRIKLLILLGFYEYIYGKDVIYSRLLKSYNSVKHSIGVYYRLNNRLRYNVLPKYYSRAIEYNLEHALKRAEYLENYYIEMSNMTPISLYEDAAGDNIVNLFFNLYSDLGDNDDGFVKKMNNFFKYMKDTYNVTDENELRDYYINIRAIRAKKAKENEEKNKAIKLKKKLNDACDSAIKGSNRIYKLINNNPRSVCDLMLRAMNYKNPKIYILVNANSSRKDDPPLRYINKNGKIITGLNNSMIFEEDETSEVVKELFESGKFGYAELLLH